MYVNNQELSTIAGKYIFVDNDFLGHIFADTINFEKTLRIFSRNYLTIDQFTEFEFLREVFLPIQRSLKSQFISQDEVFFPQPNHQEIFNKVSQNALILSQIYAHQSQKNGQKGWSSIDLFLAGKVMLHYHTSLLITGNKKHFPSCIFDIISIFNIEKKDGGIQPFCLLEFNMDKFNFCYNTFKELENKKFI